MTLYTYICKFFYLCSGYRIESPFGRDKILVTFMIFIFVHSNKSLDMHSISTCPTSSCLPPVPKVE